MTIWRRWWFRSLISLTSMIVVGLAYLFWNRHHAKAEHDETIAWLDARDPRWRLADIESGRRAVPDADNGAFVILAAAKSIPDDRRRRTEQLFDELQQTRLERQHRAFLRKRLRDRLDQHADGLAKSRTMSAYPRGRFAIEYAPDSISTLIADQVSARDPAMLLALDVHNQIEEQHLDRALLSTRAILNIGRAFDDEPLFITQLLRMSLQSTAVACLERILANGEIDDAELVQMQKLLDEEALAEPFMVGMRGERASMYQCLTSLLERDMPVTSALGEMTRGRVEGRPQSIGLWEYAFDLYAPTMVHRSRAWLLRFHTKVLDAAGKPKEERHAALENLDRAFHDAPELSKSDLMLAKTLAPAFMNVADAERRTDTQLHCAIAALASERFRLKNRRWPTILNELVASRFLAAVPLDLYTGEPLKLRDEADGITICSAGSQEPDRSQPKGRDAITLSVPPRTEFRLWNPKQRRKPAIETDNREWITGKWRSHKLDVGKFTHWPEAVEIELEARLPDEIDLVLIGAGGERNQYGFVTLSKNENSLSVGAGDDRLQFTYRLPTDVDLILDSVIGPIHVELRRAKDDEE